MSSALAKAAALPLALAATWTTAQADDFRVSVAPTENLSHLRLFTERSDYDAFFFGPNSSTVQDQNLGGELGPLASGSTYSTTVSTSYGTSSMLDLPFVHGSELELGALAVTSGGELALSSTAISGTTYSALFGIPTGISQNAALSAATTGDKATASALYPADSSNALYGNTDDLGVRIATLYAFDSAGSARSIGTVTIQAVPEPASMAALGLGALGLLRRRKK